MSTLVQIKRSTLNAAPVTLDEGELAYSYVSNTLFIGDTANGVLNIGGKYYTDLLDNGTASNSASTFVRRYANGTSQFEQLDILVGPTANSHVATKQYVDDAVQANVTLSSLNDVDIGPPFSDQNNRILVGNSAGYYVGVQVSGNVTISNTGIITIGIAQVQNDMLAANSITVTANAGLGGGGTVSLGNTISIDVIAGDGISNANGDSVSVDSTVVRTDRPQTLNGSSYTFSNTVSFNNGINVTGNIYLNGNTTYINVSTLNVSDPLIYLAANNDASDTVDIGFMGGKNTSGTYSHTGLVRHAADGNWYLFDGLADEGHEGNIVDVANTTYALLKANLEAKSLNVNAGYANVNTTLTVVGNTSLLSNLTVTQNTTVSGNLTVVKDSKANTFVSTSQNVVPPNLANTNGERLRLFDFDTAGRPNYAIGVEGSHVWLGVDSNANTEGWKFYGNTSLAARLSANGVLNVANTIQVVNVFATNISLTSTLTTENIAVLQNVNVSGTLNVSSATFLSSLSLGSPLPVSSGGTGLTSYTANGVFYGSNTNTLSFATGTEGEVLQIKLGVPTFDMLDGGSF